MARWRASGLPNWATPRRARARARRTGSPPAGAWSPRSASCSPSSEESRRARSTPGSVRAATARSPSIAAARTSSSPSWSGCTREGHEFTAISEERGEVAFGDSGSAVRVVVDPLDGSLNARRMLPAHSLSIAVASGLDDGRRRARLRVRLRRRRGVLRAPRPGGDARRPELRAARPRLRPRGRGDRVARSPSARCPCSRRSPARPTGSGRSARSRSPSATWAEAASTAC